jgi:hypothetical protein
MIRKSAHKVIGDENKPGQIVNKPDQTLGDYLARKKRYAALDDLSAEVNAPPKKTFKEWSIERYGTDLTQYYVEMCSADMLECWKAAQENA